MRVGVARLARGLPWLLPGRDLHLLSSFARAEASSLLDLLAAARQTTSPERRALYVQHALDEAKHARMFSSRAAQLRAERGLVGGDERVDFEDLFARLGEVGFLAFVHRGEARGRRQFEVHRDTFARRGDARTEAMFETILGDERRHESYTGELLVELAGKRGAKKALRRAAWWEAWRLWRRAGRFVAQLLFWAVMMLAFVALTPLGLLVRAVMPAPRGWLREPPR